MARIGSLISGKYEILKYINKGGMSEVYLAMDVNLNKSWCIKEIKKSQGDVFVRSALKEADLMKRLDHPCIPRIVDIIDGGESVFIVMDYVEGESLEELIKNRGPQPEELVIMWAENICDTLDYLHTQTPPIIYRDIKPANIMLQPNGLIKIIDFGAAREYSHHKNGDTENLGTKGFAAPEQFKGNNQTDARTDIYALGITMHYLLTGKNPSEEPYELYPIRYYNQNLSKGLENIIKKCTRENPDERYESANELLYSLWHYDELDEKHLRAQYFKLAGVALCLVLTIMSLLAGLATRVHLFKRIEEDFNKYIMIADTLNDKNESYTVYKEAIDLKTSDKEAYLKVINLFKEDGVLDEEEETKLRSLISDNLSQLVEKGVYSDIAFEVGKTYWYYYGYGSENGTDNALIRMKASIPWFESAIQYGDENFNSDEIDIYLNIAKFNRDINLYFEEASDAGMYGEYFTNLSSLYDYIENEQSELLQFEVYELIINSAEIYSRKFKQDGVEEKDMENILNDVIDRVDKIEPSSDKTTLIKQRIKERAPYALESVKNAYLE